MVTLDREIKAAEAITKQTRFTKQLIVNLKCRLWVTKGTVESGFDFRKLTEISNKYIKIGKVPVDYFHP